MMMRGALREVEGSETADACACHPRRLCCANNCTVLHCTTAIVRRYVEQYEADKAERRAKAAAERVEAAKKRQEEGEVREDTSLLGHAACWGEGGGSQKGGLAWHAWAGGAA